MEHIILRILEWEIVVDQLAFNIFNRLFGQICFIFGELQMKLLREKGCKIVPFPEKGRVVTVYRN